MSFAVPEEPEPPADHWRKSTWRMCIVLSCNERVDPWAHSYRCAAHRDRSVARHIGLVTPDEARELVATAISADPEMIHRLLDVLIDEHPNLIASAIRALESPECGT